MIRELHLRFILNLLLLHGGCKPQWRALLARIGVFPLSKQRADMFNVVKLVLDPFGRKIKSEVGLMFCCFVGFYSIVFWKTPWKQNLVQPQGTELHLSPAQSWAEEPNLLRCCRILSLLKAPGGLLALKKAAKTRAKGWHVINHPAQISFSWLIYFFPFLSIIFHNVCCIAGVSHLPATCHSMRISCLCLLGDWIYGSPLLHWVAGDLRESENPWWVCLPLASLNREVFILERIITHQNPWKNKWSCCPVRANTRLPNSKFNNAHMVK